MIIILRLTSFNITKNYTMSLCEFRLEMGFPVLALAIAFASLAWRYFANADTGIASLVTSAYQGRALILGVELGA